MADEYNWIKKFLIGLASALLIQLGGAIWWAATITAKQDFIQSEMDTIKNGTTDRYRGADAIRDFTLVRETISELQNKLGEDSNRISRLEGMYDKNKEKL